MKKPRTETARGSAVIITMCLMLALLIFSVGFVLLPWQEYILNNRVYRGAIAINLAEAGVDYACWAVNSAGEIDSWEGENPKTKTVTEFKTYGNETKGDFYVEVSPGPSTDTWFVESVGYVPGMNAPSFIKRTVKALLAPALKKPFKGVFVGDIDVTMGGGGYTDSYDSRDGAYGGENVGSNGDILTNGTGEGAVNLDSNITVNGSVATGPGGTVTGGATITGDVTDDFSMEMPYYPPPDKTYNVHPGDGVLTLTGGACDSYSYENGYYYKFTQIKLTSTSVLTIDNSEGTEPIIFWITGYKGKSIDQVGSSSIHCIGDVRFYVDAEVSLAGDGVTNESQLPTDCLFFGSASCTRIDLGGSNDFYGAVYAPNSEINLGGSEDRYGAFVGKELAIGGGGAFHYDEALGALTLPGATYSLRYWQEWQEPQE
jgi:hypothetical protein